VGILREPVNGFNGIADSMVVCNIARIVLNWILQIFTYYCLAGLQQRRSAGLSE
jgi:hypothetical protein